MSIDEKVPKIYYELREFSQYKNHSILLFHVHVSKI